MVYWIFQFILVGIALGIGSLVLKGVDLKPRWLSAFGAAILLGVISMVLQPIHFMVTDKLPPWAWTLFYITWDGVLLLLLSRFVSSIHFQKWYWAFLLATISAIFQTLGWYIIPISG